MLLRILILVLCVAHLQGWANNVALRSLHWNGKTLSLEAVWENGWNLQGTSAQPANHDALWLFIKSKTLPNQPSLAVRLASVLAKTEGFDIKLSGDKLGCFISPAPGRQFARDSCHINLQLADDVQGELSAHAIEMVWIGEGSFYVGDSSSQSCFSNASGKPFMIESESPIQVNGSSRSTLYTPGAGGFNLPSAFPKGYAGFYLMKYEISQAQWAAFLNDIGPLKNRIYPDYGGIVALRLYDPVNQSRNGLMFGERTGIDGNANGIPGEESDGLHRAATHLSFHDLLAYADWAGMRPISELEFEKACRGPAYPQAKEFAWGQLEAQAVISMAEDGTDMEHASSGNVSSNGGIANFARPIGMPQLGGPMRVGALANLNSTRTSAGTGYFGAFELSGNVWEQCVAVDSESQAFTNNFGDGALDYQGRADVPSWASIRPIVRGGGWNSLVLMDMAYPFRDLAISDRFYQTLKDPNQRRNTTGGRLAR